MDNFETIYKDNFELILLSYIKNLYDKYDSSIINYFKTNNKFLHMSLDKVDDLFILKANNLSENLIHTDNTINTIIHNLDYFIFDNTFSFKILVKKKIRLDKNGLSKMIDGIKNSWKDIKIYNYNVGFNTVIFSYNDKLYYIDKFNSPNIRLVADDKYILQLVEKSEIPFITNIITNVIICSHKVGHIMYYKNNHICEDIFLEKSDNIYYSCFDELVFDLENLSNINEQKKKITSGGFILNYKDTDFVLNTYIYQKIQDIIPPFKNINKCFLELYKNDNLSFVINYMSPYPFDIIKRVNLSIKTLSREFLNIYHVTRKKANSELYNILSNNYRTILFDLHKIFIYTRKSEEGVVTKINNIINSDEEFNEKKSLNHDIIYKYLKKINIGLLCDIFIDRIELLNKIQNITIDMNNIRMNCNEFKILFTDCIHTKTMSHLLKLY
jgi:hypothetical protein